MIEMYWAIVSTILQHQTQEPWGSKVLKRLAANLKAAFPHVRGFSRSNLFYMSSFASSWDLTLPDTRGRVGNLSWGHSIELLKLKDPRRSGLVRRQSSRVRLETGGPGTPDSQKPKLVSITGVVRLELNRPSRVGLSWASLTLPAAFGEQLSEMVLSGYY